MKTDPLQKKGFSENATAHPFLIKVPKMHNFLGAMFLFNLTIWKPTTPAFQNTLTFASYLFNSRSNMRENLVHWNSLHSKKAILPTFLGQTPQFLCENYKNRTYNLHHQKAWSVAVILSLRVGVQHKETEVKYFFNTVEVECTLYPARPPTEVNILHRNATWQ